MELTDGMQGRGGEPRGLAGPVRAALEQARARVGTVPGSAGQRVLEEDNPATVRAEVEARRLQIARDVWQRTLQGWPDDDFSGASLETLLPQQQPARLIAWMRDPQARMLVLCGSTGVGKSHAAFAIANTFAGQGVMVRAYKHHRYVEALLPGAEEAPERRGDSAEMLQHRAATAPWLLLDEFGAGVPVARETGAATPNTQKITDHLLSTRLRADGRRAVITTNLELGDVRALFDDRIISRIFKAATVVEMTGPDLRKGAAQEWSDLQ